MCCMICYKKRWSSNVIDDPKRWPKKMRPNRQEMVRQVPVPVVQYIDKPVPRRSLRAVEKVVPFPQVFHEAWGYWGYWDLFADLTYERNQQRNSSIVICWHLIRLMSLIPYRYRQMCGSPNVCSFSWWFQSFRNNIHCLISTNIKHIE